MNPTAAPPRPRRVVIVTHYWPPHIGGIERVAAEQAARLAARGWDVRVATSRVPSSAEPPSSSVAVRRYSAVNVLERRFDVPVPLMSPAMLRDLGRLARWADVVVAHGHVFIGSAYAAIAARRAQTPLVLVQHSPFVEYGPLLDRVERAVDHQLGARVIRSAAAVITVSRFTQDYVSSLVPAAEPTVVHSGVDTARFTPAVPPRSGASNFLTVRRLVPRNGVDLLVDAWREARLPAGCRLVIAGGGSELQAVRRRADGDPSIDVMGEVSETDLPGLYQEADAFVLPSRHGEGFGLAAAEASACGIPVIATDSGGPTDLVRDGENGLVVEPGSAAALAKAIDRFVTDGDLRSRLQAEARATTDQLGWGRSIDRFEAILLGVLRP
ncbi:MAG TPA: glycosyltransferase family 4 protein [Acidimicrobiales bacterium]